MKNIKYLIAGIFLGIVFVKSEVISWFRIQEMFRFHSFHMFGVIGIAVLTSLISVQIIKRFSIKSISKDPIEIPNKKFSKGQLIGGVIFGVGWAITGACPGPLFAQLGSGTIVVTVSLLAAILGTWCYGKLRDHLPH